MPPVTPVLLERYLRHRRAWEVAFWMVWGLLNVVANSIVAVMDVERRSLAFAWWEPVTWEFSSTVLLLA